MKDGLDLTEMFEIPVKINFGWEEENGPASRVDFVVLESQGDGFQPDFRGYVKWDGCMNFDRSDSMMHLCGEFFIKQYAFILRLLHSYIGTHILKSRESSFEEYEKVHREMQNWYETDKEVK